jgi:hypothetical protein
MRPKRISPRPNRPHGAGATMVAPPLRGLTRPHWGHGSPPHPVGSGAVRLCTQSAVCCIGTLLHRHPARESVRGRSRLKTVHWTVFAGPSPCRPLLPHACHTQRIRVEYVWNTLKIGLIGKTVVRLAAQGCPRAARLLYMISDIFTVRPSATDFSAASASASAISPSSPDGEAGFPLLSAAIKLAISAA